MLESRKFRSEGFDSEWRKTEQHLPLCITVFAIPLYRSIMLAGLLKKEFKILLQSLPVYASCQ